MWALSGLWQATARKALASQVGKPVLVLLLPAFAPTSILPHTSASKVALLRRRELRPLYTSYRPWLHPHRQCLSSILTIHKALPPYASKPGINYGLGHWLQAASIKKRPRRGGLS